MTKLHFYHPLVENRGTGWISCPSSTSTRRNQASKNRHSVDVTKVKSFYRNKRRNGPQSKQPSSVGVLANLSQQLILTVAKQAEGQMVVHAVDWAIRTEQEEAAQRSKHPNCPRVQQWGAGGGGSAVHFWGKKNNYALDISTIKQVHRPRGRQESLNTGVNKTTLLASYEVLLLLMVLAYIVTIWDYFPYQTTALLHEAAALVARLLYTRGRRKGSTAACPAHWRFPDSLLGSCIQSHHFAVGVSRIQPLPEAWYTVGLMYPLCFYHTLSELSASEERNKTEKLD